jgi:hypothetical protein
LKARVEGNVPRSASRAGAKALYNIGPPEFAQEIQLEVNVRQPFPLIFGEVGEDLLTPNKVFFHVVIINDCMMSWSIKKHYTSSK